MKPCLLFLIIVLTGCGTDAPEPAGTQPDTPVVHFRVPDQDTLEGQHGGFLTISLIAEKPLTVGAPLAKEHPLFAEFQDRAARLRKNLTWQGALLRDNLAQDQKAASLWESCVQQVVVSENRSAAEGRTLVVLKADVLPVTQHLRRTTNKEQKSGLLGRRARRRQSRPQSRHGT